MPYQEEVIERCKKAASEIRKDILKMTLGTGNTGAHIGGGLSMVEIMAVLYAGIMKYDTQSPGWEERDRFILSKGHGALTYYAALSYAGFIPKDELYTFKTNGTKLYGHPSINPEYSIEFSSGSLGQGLSLGVGVCLALRNKCNHTSRTFVLLGDGECDEGSVWEAAASASHYHLHNLVAIVDKNKIQYDGWTESVLSMESMLEKWESFGWEVVSVDGHDVGQLYNALTMKTDKPLAVIANTVKGCGVSFMENNPIWHNSRLTQEQYNQAIEEVCSKYD